MLFYIVQCEALTFVSFGPFDKPGYLKVIYNLDFVKISAADILGPVCCVKTAAPFPFFFLVIILYASLAAA